MITALNNLDCVIDKYQDVLSTTCGSPTDAISDCLNVDYVLKRFFVTSFFLVAADACIGDSLGLSVWPL